MAKPRSIPLKDAYQLFLLDCEARRFTEATLAYYRQRLGNFVRWAVGQQVLSIQELNSNHIKQYMVTLQQRNLAGYSLLAEYRAIRRFCNFAISEGWIAENPIRKVKAPQVDKDIRRLFTPTEVKKLLDACKNEREEALIFFLFPD
jgi:integrase/recombinase XerD